MNCHIFHIAHLFDKHHRHWLIALSSIVALSLGGQEPVLRIGGNVYGGGNKGNLQLETNVEVKGGEIVGAVYGGARMADVLSTNVVVTGGTINYVYGGNDITGKVKQETNVDIRSSIVHDVYGGGNGSYVYTDIEANKSSSQYADFY